MEDNTRVTTPKKKSRFWLGLAIYAGVLVILVISALVYVWNTMKQYEASQPEKVVEEIVSELSKGDISSVQDQVTSKFESSGEYAELFTKAVKGQKLTFAQDGKKYTTSSPVYDVLLDKKTVAVVSLKETAQHQKLGILTISDWKVDKVVASVKGGENQVKITVPDGYTVLVNKVALSKDEQSGEAKELGGFKYASEYVKAPKMVTYEVNGLINQPELVVKDASGNPVDLSAYTDHTKIAISYPVSEISKELSDYVITAAKAYSNFFSKDLEGSSKSTACLQPYFPQKSYYIDLAEQYRKGDMWMYSDHSAPVFSNVAVKNYTVYAKDCFSCEIVFDKSMVLTLNNQTRVDHNNQTYYFVKIDGKWLIADIQNNIKSK